MPEKMQKEKIIDKIIILIGKIPQTKISIYDYK
jgi:hypothetical protein